MVLARRGLSCFLRVCRGYEDLKWFSQAIAIRSQAKDLTYSTIHRL